MEMASTISQSTNPELAFQKVLEELHKMQKLVVMQNLLQPYANEGYSTSQAMNSERLREYNKEWYDVHNRIAKHANKFVLPQFLSSPDSYLPGFDYRRYRRGSQ
jgi:hypothetical protein